MHFNPRRDHRLGQVGGGPVVGAIGLRASLRAAMVVSGAVLSPALLLYVRAARHSKAAGTPPHRLEAGELRRLFP